MDKTENINTTYTDTKGKRVTGTIGAAYTELTGKNLKTDGGQYTDTTAGEAAVAVGVKSEAGDISLALGTAAKAKVVNGVAIGSGATANRDNAVAIGGGSTTDAEGTKETEITINKLTFKWAGGDRTVSGDVVSFGKDQFERQLKHVAPGKVSENSTDAINGSQLHGVLTHLIEDPVFMFGADNSSESNAVGDTPEKKQKDGENKKIVTRSISDSRLNILGGADGELSDKNISVKYEDKQTLKIKLAKKLTELESAEFKNTAGDKTVINGDGVTITPVTAGKEQVSLTKDGLNNGGNQIANVGGNLDGAKTGTTVPTTKAAAPNDVVGIKNNAATVGDVLQSGWNLQANGVEKDFVKPYDTVNFVNGNGTTVVVETKGNKVSTIKYNVNLGDIESVTTGTVKVTDGDTGKIATVDSVVDAVNSAAFTLKASADGGTLNANSTVKAKGELIKAGNTIEMIAGKNLEVKHNKNGKITFATVENPSFETVQIGDDGPKFSATSGGNISVSDKDGTNPVKITNVKDGEISKTSKDAINGSQFHKLANNTIKLAGQNGSNAATETDAQNLNQQDGIKFTVKSSDGELLEVTAGGDTITLTPKTGTITTTNGVPTATTTNGKLVTADQLVSALTEMGWKATADKDGTGTVTGTTSELIKAGNTVTFKAGDNLAIKQDGKNFIYSLNTALSGLTSAEFKDGDNKVNITPTGITITKPAGTTENTVTLNQDGLNNGGNLITNVASNLKGAKTGTTAPTTKAAAPDDVVGIKNNAATVGDVLNAGWNLQGNGEEKDFVQPYDTVNFINGDGTTATVETTNNKVSTVKYSVNLGNGLKKDDTGNTISIKPADKSLEVNKDGVKVKTDGTTITTDDNKGLKVVTGAIESVTTGTDSGTVKVKEGDTGKIATVDSVVNAVNSAAFTLKASATTGGTRNGSSSVGENGEDIKAGKTIEMIAGKNLNVTHNENGKIIFATVDTPTFSTVQVGGDQGPKFSKTSDGDIKVSDKDGANPVKVTNVKDGAVTDTSTDAINGSQFHKVANNTIKLAGQNGDDATTATQTKEQNLNKQGGIKFTVKSSDGKLLEVKAADDTITLTPKTATITTGTDGVPTANTNGGKLVTADDLVTALKNMGWKAIAGNDGTGTVEGNAEELIKAGNTVTFKAGDNLKIKQSAKEFIYSLNPELTGLTSAKFKDTAGNTSKLDVNGLTITPNGNTDPNKNVSITKDGINAGNKAITNVASNLTNYNSGNKDGLVNLSTTTTPNSNVATVGDLRNMGWIVSSDKTTGDLNKAFSAQVKNANEVEFIGKNNAVVSATTDRNGKHTVTVDVTVPAVEKGTIETATGNDKGKVKSKVGDENKFTTVDTVVNAINSAAWKATSGTEGSGAEAAGHTKSDAEIKAGDTVTFKAGDNLKIKQSGKEFTYSLNPELTNLSKVEVKDGNNVVTTTPTGTTTKDKDGNETKVTKDGITITPVTPAGGTAPSPVSLTKTGLDNGGNKITNVDDGDVTANSKDAINGSQFHKVAKNTIKLAGQNGTATATETDGQDLDKTGGIKFTVKSSDGTLLDVTASGDTITLTPKTATLTADTNGVPTANTTGGKLVTADDLITTLKGMGWKATAGKDGTGTVTGNTEELIKAGETVTFKAGDNLKIKQDGKNFIYSLNPELTGLTSAEFKDATGNTSKLDGNGITITPATPAGGTAPRPVSLTQNGLDNGGNKITNVTSGLDNFKDKTGTEKPLNDLRDLNKVGADEKPVVKDNTAATVGDLRNLGWIVSSDKTTGDLTNAYAYSVKHANEVKFVGTGLATVSGKTEINGVRTITVNVDPGKAAENSPFEYGIKDPTTGNVTPVVKATDGKYYKPADLNDDGTPKVSKTPLLDPNNVSDPNKNNLVVNAKGDKPQEVKNIKSNLPATYNKNDNKLDADGKPVKDPTTGNITTAGTSDITKSVTAPTPADLAKVVNNAATVGDVLNAGWNLKNNGEAKDFVKPYDTVNFVDGMNTRAVVTTDENGKVSNVTYNVTGLPITYTKADGTPVTKVGDKYYEVDPATGKPDMTKEVQPGDLKTNLVNPNVATDKQTTTPTQLGNVANGAKTYDAPEVNGKKVVQAKDGKWYNATDVVNGTAKENATPVTTPVNPGKAGLVDFSKSNPTSVATVGDLMNMGWIVSSDKTTGNLGTAYNDQVRNANEVRFVGKGTATVSGKTDGNVRTITVEVNDQLSTNNSVTPVVYTKADGTQVYPIKQVDGTTKFNTKPDGTGAEIPKTDVITSVNGPEGTTSPTTLKNIAGNLEGAKKDTNTPTTNAAAPNDVVGIKNNAATVGDVLNAGWNLQNNGTAKDFVKPYDTVNFVNGGNTTAVVTTDKDGTTSHVTYNVTGLPVTYTNEDGKPVSKVGDNYYVVNDKGQPLQNDGTPVTKYDTNGNPLNNDGTPVTKVDTTAKPLKTNLVNPNVATDKQTTTPTQLGNVANGAKTFEAKADANGNPLIKVGTDYYTAD